MIDMMYGSAILKRRPIHSYRSPLQSNQIDTSQVVIAATEDDEARRIRILELKETLSSIKMVKKKKTTFESAETASCSTPVHMKSNKKKSFSGIDNCRDTHINNLNMKDTDFVPITLRRKRDKICGGTNTDVIPVKPIPRIAGGLQNGINVDMSSILEGISKDGTNQQLPPSSAGFDPDDFIDCDFIKMSNGSDDGTASTASSSIVEDSLKSLEYLTDQPYTQITKFNKLEKKNPNLRKDKRKKQFSPSKASSLASLSLISRSNIGLNNFISKKQYDKMTTMTDIDGDAHFLDGNEIRSEAKRVLDVAISSSVASSQSSCGGSRSIVASRRSFIRECTETNERSRILQPPIASPRKHYSSWLKMDASEVRNEAERILEAVDRHLECIVSDSDDEIDVYADDDDDDTEVTPTPVGSHLTLETEEKGYDWIVRSSGWI